MRRTTRRNFLRTLGSAAGAMALSGRGAIAAPKPLNVLMIPVDDLRPQLGCFGYKQMLTPNIDRLAATGTLFRRAYTMFATCSPSRTCLLTGTRPDTNRIYDLETHFRTTLPEVVTLPQHFMRNGYKVMGMGKVFHGSLNDLPSWDPWVEVPSGSQWLDPKTLERMKELQEEARKAKLSGKARDRATRGTVMEGMDVADEDYFDGAMAERAVKELKSFAASGQRFFLAVGFKKPHLPFISPKKYWDMYSEETIATAPNPFHPKNMPEGAVDGFPGEMNSYYDARELADKQKAKGINDFPEDFARKLIHAYYACVTYVDTQIGKLLDTLEETGLAENTVVALWGDHGWHLGENGTWGKHTNLEWGTHAPLIVRIPGQAKAGVGTDGFAEFVDVYPTLSDACGLPIPEHCEGISLLPLMADPGRAWKGGAFSQFRKTINGTSAMGYTMRTDKFRYTEWRKRTDDGEVAARELYDHRQNHDENENIAGNPEYAAVVEEMAARLRGGYKAALPK